MHRRESLSTDHREVARRGGNTVNPMLGSGMQQAREALGGATRQGGEKPRRRPATSVWQRRSEAHRLR